MDKTKVCIDDRQHEVKIPTGTRLLIRRCCNAVLDMEKFNDRSEVNVYFVDADYIRQINREKRGKDMVTDVLSFPLGEKGQYDVNPETGAKMLGEIMICVSRAQEQAEQYGHSFRREIAYLTAHSMLHLLGYDHLDEGTRKKAMRAREKGIMKLLEGESET